MMMKWYETGRLGRQPDMPAPGFTWKTTPQLNAEIWKKYQDMPLDRVQALLKDSHHNLQVIIKAHTNQELFEKQYFAWTGSTSLGSYLTSATSSHYGWAIKLIKKFIRVIDQ